MTSVVDAKVNKKQNYAIVDGGIHQLVYYGQSMAMKHPYCHVLPEKQEGETMDWNLFGSLCTVNDILVKQMPVRNLTVGDVIVFEKYRGLFNNRRHCVVSEQRSSEDSFEKRGWGDPMCCGTALTPTH